MKFQISFKKSLEGVRPELWICLFLAVAILAIYWPVGGYEFIGYDDPQYVVDNDPVRKGLTPEGFQWAFASMHASNWHPITWLSHMLDVQLYGMNAGAHHLTNVLFHTFNSMLLFLLLHRMTGAMWRSAMVAALFAVHPLHVESVAWISERKDVLSAFFGFLTLLAYAEYVKRPGWMRYGAALLMFALGLMSKPMVVTLPFLMLLLDYWPLNRYAEEGCFRRFAALIKEKLPFFALSAASCVVTMIAQGRGGTVASLEVCSFGIRLTNALLAYVAYLGKMIWPINLALLYPHPGMRPMWQVIGAVLGIIGISSAAFLWARRRPWFGVGWLWYLGTLVPVIGLVQVGSQAMADRYAYTPLIGIYIVLVWSFYEVFDRWLKPTLALAGIVVTAVLILIAGHQVRYWENNIALFSHTLDVTRSNGAIHNNMGLALVRVGRTKEAIDHYSEAIRINKNDFKAHNNLGLALAGIGRIDEAIHHYSEAIRINENNHLSHRNLGIAFAQKAEYEQAKKHIKESLRINPANKKAYDDLGRIASLQGDHELAVSYYISALNIKPDDPNTLFSLSSAFLELNQPDKSLEYLIKILDIDPNHFHAGIAMGIALANKGMSEKAESQFQKVIQNHPLNAEGYNNLGVFLANNGRYTEAITNFKKALEIDSNNNNARNHLDRALKDEYAEKQRNLSVHE